MTERVEEVLARLPQARFIERLAVPSGFWVSTGGLSAFGGALRLFPSGSGLELPSVTEWNAIDCWRASYGQLAPEWTSVGEDALGTQYLLSPQGDEIAIFWSETAEIERVGASPVEFFEMIAADPENTISLKLYEQCVRRFGPIPLTSRYALRIETAAGGTLEPENVMVMDAREHMNAMGKIARQLVGVRPGTMLRPQ